MLSPTPDFLDRTDRIGWRQIRGPLFRKYVLWFLAVVCVALVTNASFAIWFSYREQKASIIRLEREQAAAAAAKIDEFIREIESQMGWTTQLPWAAETIEQHRFDAARLLRQVPAITELALLDATGTEQLHVSQLAMDAVGNRNRSTQPEFTQALAKGVYYGPVYFRRESEPYMTLAVAGANPASGVSVAEVNLTLIWDVVSQVKIGTNGYAYVVGEQGRLIAHPDIIAVLRNTDLSQLAQVKAARDARPDAAPAPTEDARNLQGQRVLSADARITAPGWLLFVELPLSEAYAPLYASLWRSALLLLGGLGLAFLGGLFLARRMVGPIQALRAGAVRIGGGDLGQRIKIKTGDELEALADQFNDMAGKLQESYAGLEQKVEDRTRALRSSLGQLRALAEISQTINSTLDLHRVLTTIVAKATELSDTEAGAIYVFDEGSQEFKLSATYGMDKTIIAAISERSIRRGETAVGEAAEKRRSIQIADVREDHSVPVLDVIVRAGFRALLIVPLLGTDRIVGALVVRRKAPGEFTKSIVDLLETFAAQSVLAISNARLFSENERSLSRISKELDAARKLQLGMLPQDFPRHSPGQPIEMHAFIDPAREVGGDLYDCFYVSDHSCCFLVGDVSGKGAPAALFMARTSSLVRMAAALWRDVGAEITSLRIVEIVNRELCQHNDDDMFVTIFLALLDVRTGMVDYVNAGHPHPYVLCASGEIMPVDGKPDRPLGLLGAVAFQSHTLVLHPGDRMFAFSDGIIEASNDHDVLYGHARLQAELRACAADLAPAELVRAVVESVQRFAGAAPESDDVTALALRWSPAGASM
jgi:serine phosphatase RsbU (regulator of sigma subunit)/methyl-accepting chemotaxis protein